MDLLNHLLHNHNDKTWSNWAKNVTADPEHIFHPKSLDDLKNIVKEANSKGKKIRCVAEGHSWCTFSKTKDYLVDVKKLDKITVEKSDKHGWIVIAEAGATVKQIDDTLRHHKPPLALESMTVLTSVRASGIVATSSHGAKFTGRSIPDNMVSIKIVTADGEVTEFSDEKDPQEMNVARTNFGLLGIIYTVTLIVSPMFHLRMVDSTQPLNSWLTPKNLKDLVMKSDGVEIFYWPFNSEHLDHSKDHVWVKHWERVENPVTVSKACRQGLDVLNTFGVNFIDNLYQVLVKCPLTTPFFTNLAWKLGFHDGDVILEAPDAIHYQAGIDNIPCHDVEFAFKVDNDFHNVTEEFHNIIKMIYDYANKGKFPINLAAEMRITKSSKSLMSPSHDEDPEAIYVHIEVLSIKDTPDWKEFAGEFGNRLIKKYNARPHWSKEFEDINIPQIGDHLHKVYANSVKKFEPVREKYDPNKIFFDNDTLKKIFYG